MGNCWGNVLHRRRTRRHIVLILIGLDNAGKTKTVNNLAGEKDEKVLPTVGFKAVNLVHKDTPVTIYDLGGGPEFRQIWPQYYSEVHGVIFVIDSSDFSRLDECKVVLEEVLSHDKISGKPVLVLANKQDKSGALDDIDVVEKLDIEPLVNRYRCPTLVESYSAVPEQTKKKPKLDPGLRKGYHWLLNYIERRYGDINLRVQTDLHSDQERRKRLATKAANRASQTFTAISDDIATQTGFENPNYQMPKTPESQRKEIENESDVIIVKPVRNSLDTTMTIESLDSDNTSKAKPKLSPLFGRSSKSNDTPRETVKVELEPRREFRKLSPIPLLRNKSGMNQHIDFKNRPQSSPSLTEKKIKTEPLSNNTTIQEDESQPEAAGDGDRTRESTIARIGADIGLNDKELVNRTAFSDVMAPVFSAGGQAESSRPASASQLLRRQLELAHPQRRRLSLRFIQRNKTSPEHVSLSTFEPPAKAPRRHLDKGDYERAATIK